VAARFSRCIGIRDGRVERDVTAAVRPALPAASRSFATRTGEEDEP